MVKRAAVNQQLLDKVLLEQAVADECSVFHGEPLLKPDGFPPADSRTMPRRSRTPNLAQPNVRYSDAAERKLRQLEDRIGRASRL